MQEIAYPEGSEEAEYERQKDIRKIKDRSERWMIDRFRRYQNGG